MRDESPINESIRAAQAEGLPMAAVEQRIWERYGTTCAVLALDSSGMTRISRAQGIVYFLSRYLEMRDVAGEIIERHECLAWRCFVDNLFAEFRTTNAALAAALEIHAALRQRRLMLTETEPYCDCIGIGFGRVLQNGGLGVMGDEMNLVAKLAEDVAADGETLLTDAALRSLDATAALVVEPRAITISKVDLTCHCVRPRAAGANPRNGDG